MTCRLIEGDALTVLRHTLPDDSADAIITDPPYSSGGMHIGAKSASTAKKYQASDTVRTYPDFYGDSRDQRGWLAWSSLWLADCWRIARDGAPICLFSDWRVLPTVTDALQIAGFTWRGLAVWDKTEGARPQPGRFRAQCEYVIWGSKGEFPIDRNAPILPGCFREAIRQEDKYHLTGKPTALMRQIVRICEAGGTILDPFAGSGTTLVAAKAEGFHSIGIEMSPEYLAIAKERLDATPGPLFQQAFPL